ncbi:MAG: hypothetical protein ACREXP_08020 [Steroidobacteraceae bacterium]
MPQESRELPLLAVLCESQASSPSMLPGLARLSVSLLDPRSDDYGTVYKYVGKARDGSRLVEYRNNMLQIHSGRERGAGQNYRAVHFAIYKALASGWNLAAYPIENCEDGQVNLRERQRILH